MTPGLTWTPRHLLLGALFALPALVAAPFDSRLAMVLAIGVLPAAAIGLPAKRSARVRYLVVGLAIALGMVIGAVISGSPWLALVVLFAACVGAAQFSGRGPVGALVLALGVPMIGVGLSFDDVPTAFTAGAAILLGCVWSLAVALLWPEREVAPHPSTASASDSMLGFGIRLALAATIAAGIGYLLGLDHVGWAVGAALFVMRPSAALLASRALARAASVLTGAAIAGAFMLTTPPGWAMGLAALAILAVLTALAGSRWYVTGGFSTMLVFLLLLDSDPADVAHRFWERSLETLLGVGLALVFGLLVPWAARLLRTRGG